MVGIRAARHGIPWGVVSTHARGCGAQCVNDSSAYVRKAAAHAIPKVYSLDRDQQVVT